MNDAPKPKKETKTEKRKREKQALLLYYKHIHRKNSLYTFDARREKKLDNGLKYLGVARSVQAILGNLYIDWYQGMNKEGRVYDDLFVIFKHAGNSEKFIDAAEEQGITAEIALKDFEAFVQGNPSPYRKPDVKAAQTVQKRSELPNSITVQVEVKYRTFAHSIAAFFFQGNDAKEMLEFCDENKGLSEQGAELYDGKFLGDCLVAAGRVLREVPEQVEIAMREFAESYCELRELNR